MGTTRNMFHILELAEGHNYDAPPYIASLALCMAVAKRRLYKSTNIEIPDMICAYGCEATEEDVEAAVIEKTGLRTPWLKYTLHEFVEHFEDKAGIVTWETVSEAGRTIMKSLNASRMPSRTWRSGNSMWYAHFLSVFRLSTRMTRSTMMPSRMRST
jgi:hypothetical protein